MSACPQTNPTPYIEWHNVAYRRWKRGERQEPCLRCGRLVFRGWAADKRGHKLLCLGTTPKVRALLAEGETPASGA